MGKKIQTNDDLAVKIDTLNKLLILYLFYNDVPPELIAIATGMHPNSIRNMFPIKKYKKGTK